MQAHFYPYQLEFKQASGTSRGILKTKNTWLLILKKDQKRGFGECGMFKGLSFDDRPDFEQKLQWACDHVSHGLDFLLPELTDFPSIQFGFEMAFRSLHANHPFELFPSEFTSGRDSIPINGLIWMGDRSFMASQIKEKIEAGFTCIKMKIGAIDFETELDLLRSIRSEFSEEDIELRVDANGAFQLDHALEKLKRLSDFKLHSIDNR